MSENITPVDVVEPQKPLSLDQTITRLVHLIDDRPGSEGMPGTDPQEFLKRATVSAAEFQKNYAVEGNILTEEKKAQFNSWIEKDLGPQGEHHLEKLARTVIEFWGEVKREGLPGHDRRHLLEDLKAALQARVEVVQAGGKDPYGAVALIGSLMHDSGRLAEERVFGTQTGGEMGKAHAQMSFALTKDILDHFTDIPQDLRDHIAHSVLNHQTWPPTEDAKNAEPLKFQLIMDEPMPRAVMGADRLQLVGPEAILRMWGFDVGMADKPLDIATKINEKKKTALKIPDHTNTDLAHHIEFYMRNLLPVDVPGTPEKAREQARQRAKDFQAISATYLWLSSPDEIREQIFAPELTRAKGEQIDTAQLTKDKKTPLAPDVWEKVQKAGKVGEGLDPEILRKMQSKLSGRSLEQLNSLDETSLNIFLKILAKQLVTVPNASVTEREVDAINAKLTEVKGKEEKARLLIGLAYAITMREDLDRKHDHMMSAIMADKENYPEHSLERTFAQFASSQK